MRQAGYRVMPLKRPSGTQYVTRQIESAELGLHENNESVKVSSRGDFYDGPTPSGPIGIEATPGLASEISGQDHPLQERRSGVRRLAELLEHDVRDVVG